MRPLRMLFVKESQNWPRSSGHDVHGYGMMSALIARGHEVSLATIAPPTEQALAGLKLDSIHELEKPTRGNGWALTPWQHKFTNYYGTKDEWFAALAGITQQHEFDAVVVVARHLLPLLAVVRNCVRVWYPADDPAWHHISRVKLRERKTWNELRPALVNALYERAFRPCFDRVWVVSSADRTATSLITGCRHVDLIPNGIDAEHYRPGKEFAHPFSSVFWGRLDFGPNVDALDWYLKRIWPAVRATTPSATFAVFGFNPTQRVREMIQLPGVELHPDLPDLRAEVQRRQVVVLPFVTGGGIKNKLLEAAAMGMPIVCTRWALSGTKGTPAVRVARSAADWANALATLWNDSTARTALGASARRWMLTNHTWDAAARTAEAGIARGPTAI